MLKLIELLSGKNRVMRPDMQKICGFFAGAATGDALALPYYSSKKPIKSGIARDILGYADMHTEGGTTGTACDSFFDFIDFFLTEYDGSFDNERFINLCECYYIKNLCEDDDFDVRLTAAAFAASLFAVNLDCNQIKTKKEFAFDKRILPGLFIFKYTQQIFKNIKPSKSLKTAENYCTDFCRSNKLNLESRTLELFLAVKETALKSAEFKNFQSGMENFIPQSEYGQITGLIVGGLAGFVYNFENIPYFWKQNVKKISDYITFADKVYYGFFKSSSKFDSK